MLTLAPFTSCLGVACREVGKSETGWKTMRYPPVSLSPDQCTSDTGCHSTRTLVVVMGTTFTSVTALLGAAAQYTHT